MKGSHTLRIPHTCIRAGPESKDLAVGSKEGMRTKLTRDLRGIQLRESQKHSLAAGSKDTGEMKALQKITPRTEGCPWVFQKLILLQKLQENLHSFVDGDRKSQKFIKNDSWD